MWLISIFQNIYRKRKDMTEQGFNWDEWDALSPEEQRAEKSRLLTPQNKKVKRDVNKILNANNRHLRHLSGDAGKILYQKGDLKYTVPWKKFSVKKEWFLHNHPNWSPDEAEVYNSLEKMPLSQAISESRIQKIVNESIRKVLSESMEGDVYSMEDWERDGTLKIQPGQAVSDDIVRELLNCVPPATYGKGIFQPGEPWSHDRNTGRQLFQTFERDESGWRYVGIKPLMQR